MIFPAPWLLCAQPRSSSCSRACPCSRRSTPATSSASPSSRSRASSSSGQVVFREGDASDTCYIVRDGRARAVRAARRRAHDHARDLRSRRHLRRAGDVRGRAPLGDGRSDRADERGGGAGPRHAPADERAPRDLHPPGDRPRPAPARDQRAPRRASPFRPSRAASPAVLSRARRPGESPTARPARTCSSPPPRPTSRSWPAPRASPPAAFWPCSSARGVISQGRGRLVVHDAAARWSSMSSRPPSESSRSSPPSQAGVQAPRSGPASSPPAAWSCAARRWS